MKNDRREELRAKHIDLIKKINDVIPTGKYQDIDKMLQDLKKIEADYKSVTEKWTYDEIDTAKELIIKAAFSTISHKVEKDESTKVMVRVCPESKEVQVDLLAFCKQKSLSLDWYYEMQALNKRLTLKAAVEHGLTAGEIKTIDQSYSMKELAQKIDIGALPTGEAASSISKNSCVKHLQKILDMVAPESGKVTTHDINALIAWHTKGVSDPKSYTTACRNHRGFMSDITKVFGKIMTGGKYAIDYKKNKDSAPVESKPTDAPTVESTVES